MYQAAAVPNPTETGGHFTLTPLPYAEDALAPVISRETVALHYGKHHRAYVDKLNQLVEGTQFARMPIDEIVKRTAAVAARAEIFNNAGQAWNHHFYWRSLAPGGGRPGEELRRRLDRDLGGYDAFAEAFTKAAVAQFGSGWAWLVFDDGELKIMTTANGDSPMARGMLYSALTAAGMKPPRKMPTTDVSVICPSTIMKMAGGTRIPIAVAEATRDTACSGL